MQLELVFLMPPQLEVMPKELPSEMLTQSVEMLKVLESAMQTQLEQTQEALV